MKRKSIITVLGIAAVAALTPTVASAQGIFSVTIGSGSGYGYDGYGYGGYSNNDRHPTSTAMFTINSMKSTLGRTSRAWTPGNTASFTANFATSTLRNIIKSPVSISASTTTTIGATTRATEMMDITGTELA
jgi:hypothetical protein